MKNYIKFSVKRSFVAFSVLRVIPISALVNKIYDTESC